MHQLFRHPSVKDVSSILLVGGFAESPMLQEAVKEAFSEIKVTVPQDAGLAVLKGAVLYVNSRRPSQLESANIHMELTRRNDLTKTYILNPKRL